MKKTLLIVLILVAVIVAGYAFALKRGNHGVPGRGEPSGVACTMDAKLCPDGSYVGRVPPSCEFAACPDASSTLPHIVPYDSGIRGTVTAGPTCPVERTPADPNCADKPLSTLVAIFRASDTVHAYALFDSGPDGTFSASLPPGDYVIGAGKGGYPMCPQTPVTVSPSVYASVTVRCDTGIR